MILRIGRFISGPLAFVIVGGMCAWFVIQGYDRPLEQFASFAVAIFGISLVLSHACFTAATTLTAKCDKDRALYVGERFLHAGLLLLQGVGVKYTEKSLIGTLGNMKLNSSWVHNTIGILFVVSSGAAAYLFLRAFGDLNDWLWSRWVKHDEEVAKVKRAEPEAKEAETVANGVDPLLRLSELSAELKSKAQDSMATIAAGALALSVTLRTTQLAPSPKSIFLLRWSWLTLAACVVLVITDRWIASWRMAVHAVNATLPSDGMVWVARALIWGSFVTFIVGICLLAAFGWVNL